MKQALLVIDVQNEYFTGKLPITYPKTGFYNILKAMDEAAKKQIDIVVVQHTAQLSGSPTFKKDSHEWDLHPAVNFLSDATGTLAINNAAGSVTAEELHRAILVTQEARFSKVLSTAEWINRL